jgi:hypothetical protein
MQIIALSLALVFIAILAGRSGAAPAGTDTAKLRDIFIIFMALGHWC